jgi:transposase
MTIGGIRKVKRLSMDKTREILKLKEEGFSYRDIAASVGCGKTVIGETILRAEASGIRNVIKHTGTEIEALLYPEKQSGTDTKELDMVYILAELSRKHVTRQLLWEEYKQENPDGLMYSQFCERIRHALKANEIEYHKHHKAGEECEVDWAGTTIPYYDSEERAWKDTVLFVGVLPASAYPFARVYPDQKTPSWIDAHVRMFRFFGGTPRILVPDCTKTAVTTPDLFDPVITKTYQEMAAHYDIMIIPARPRKPRDKNMVENTVGNVSRRIIAAIRNNHFTNITAINKAVGQKLKEFIDEPFKKIAGCRSSAFEHIDKPSLRPLPIAHYEFATFVTGKISPNYHIEYGGFFYSVPYEHRGSEYTIRATKDTIEVFVQGERVCAHIKRLSGNRYVTLPEHLPERHRVVSGWNDDHFIDQASKYGANTVAYIKALLNSVEYSVQAYRTCMGVLRQTKDVPLEVVETASGMALANKYISSKYFGFALKQAAKDVEAAPTPRIIEHNNIRGAFACGGGVRYV